MYSQEPSKLQIYLRSCCSQPNQVDVSIILPHDWTINSLVKAKPENFAGLKSIGVE